MQPDWIVPRIDHDENHSVTPIVRNAMIYRDAGVSSADHTRRYAAQLLAAADVVDPPHVTTAPGPRPDLVEVVARALYEHFYAFDDEVDGHSWALMAEHECGVFREMARAVLAALSSVGALMPDGGGQTREEYRVVWGPAADPCLYSTRLPLDLAQQHLAEAIALWPDARLQRQAVTTWPKGHPLAGTHYGLWEKPDEA